MPIFIDVFHEFYGTAIVPTFIDIVPFLIDIVPTCNLFLLSFGRGGKIRGFACQGSSGNPLFTGRVQTWPADSQT